MLSISVVAVAWLFSLRTLSTALDPTLEGTWRDWKATHGKEYALEEEETYRRAVWEENLQMIQDHNKEADQGKHTYKLGMNHFGDLTNQEFNKKMHCLLPGLDLASQKNVVTFKSSENLQIPTGVDWRAKGFVTEVKDQGGCGSCWAFSATGALEGMYFKKTGKLVPLSEQNLIDCSKDGNYGCQGGLMHLAFATVQQQQGINSEKSYPYDGQDDYSCRYEAENSIAACSNVGVILTGDEKALQQAVATIGPISVGVDAGSSEFQFYKSGIFKNPWKGDAHLNHAMLVIGYNSTKYWIVKNSWSRLWGDNGYMLMELGSNQCGIANDASYPIP